jgi:hypothetical protein
VLRLLRGRMAGMDQRERIIALMAVGLVAGALFASYLGTRRRGWTFGLVCGLLTAALVAVLLMPLYLAFVSGIRSLEYAGFRDSPKGRTVTGTSV